MRWSLWQTTSSFSVAATPRPERRSKSATVVRPYGWIWGSHPEKPASSRRATGGFDFWAITLTWLPVGRRRKERDQTESDDSEQNATYSWEQLAIIIKMVNQTLTGWFGYFKHSNKTAFPRWINGYDAAAPLSLRQRRKLKAVLRNDNVRWPNAFFAAQGLFSLSAAQRAVVNPPGGEPPTGEPDAGEPPVVRREGERTQSSSLPLLHFRLGAERWRGTSFN